MYLILTTWWLLPPWAPFFLLQSMHHAMKSCTLKEISLAGSSPTAVTLGTRHCVSLLTLEPIAFWQVYSWWVQWPVMQDNYVWANLMNQLDVLPWSPQPSRAYVPNFFCQRSKRSFESWVIASHPRDCLVENTLAWCQKWEEPFGNIIRAICQTPVSRDVGFQRPASVLWALE